MKNGAVKDASSGLDENRLTEGEFEIKQKELEGVVNLIAVKVCQATGDGINVSWSPSKLNMDCFREFMGPVKESIRAESRVPIGSSSNR